MKQRFLIFISILFIVFSLGCERFIEIHVVNVNDSKSTNGEMISTSNQTHEDTYKKAVEVIASADINVGNTLTTQSTLKTQAAGGNSDKVITIELPEEMDFSVTGSITFTTGLNPTGVLIADNQVTLNVSFNDTVGYTDLAVRIRFTSTTIEGLEGDVHGDILPMYVQTDNLSTSNYYLIPKSEGGPDALYQYLELYSWGSDPEAQQANSDPRINLVDIPVKFSVDFTGSRVQIYSGTIRIEFVGVAI